jgi:hypothetical protein
MPPKSESPPRPSRSSPYFDAKARAQLPGAPQPTEANAAYTRARHDRQPVPVTPIHHSWSAHPAGSESPHVQLASPQRRVVSPWPRTVERHNQNRYLTPAHAITQGQEPEPTACALVGYPSVESFAVAVDEQVRNEDGQLALEERVSDGVQRFCEHGTYRGRMSDIVNDGHSEQSVALLLQYVQRRLADWVGAMPRLDSDLLERLDLALRGQVWFDQGDETEHLALLGSALLIGKSLDEALGEYIDAKLDDGANDLLAD